MFWDGTCGSRRSLGRRMWWKGKRGVDLVEKMFPSVFFRSSVLSWLVPGFLGGVTPHRKNKCRICRPVFFLASYQQHDYYLVRRGGWCQGVPEEVAGKGVGRILCVRVSLCLSCLFCTSCLPCLSCLSCPVGPAPQGVEPAASPALSGIPCDVQDMNTRLLSANLDFDSRLQHVSCCVPDECPDS